MRTENLHLADDGFGNLLEHCGSWYHEHPEAPVPDGMIRGNYAAALMFRFGHWHQSDPQERARDVKNLRIKPITRSATAGAS